MTDILHYQDIGYAKLANLSPEYGLCKFLCCLLTPDHAAY